MPLFWGPYKTYIIPKELHQVENGISDTLDVLFIVQGHKEVEIAVQFSVREYYVLEVLTLSYCLRRHYLILTPETKKE